MQTAPRDGQPMTQQHTNKVKLAHRGTATTMHQASNRLRLDASDFLVTLNSGQWRNIKEKSPEDPLLFLFP